MQLPSKHGSAYSAWESCIFIVKKRHSCLHLKAAKPIGINLAGAAKSNKQLEVILHSACNYPCGLSEKSLEENELCSSGILNDPF